MRVLRTQRAGFTLVELLIVIAIIVVLMAIAFPVFTSARRRAKETQCMANLHQIAEAVRMYRLDSGSYPGPEDLVTGYGGVNALFPTYITNRQVLICPNDPITSADLYLNAKEFVFPPDDPGSAYKDLLTSPRMSMPNAQSMYLWQEPAASSMANKNATFADIYSSYNRYYNYLGYVTAYDPADQSRRTPLGYNFDLLDFNEKQMTVLGESIAFVYEWYRWDPRDKLKLSTTGTDPNCDYPTCEYVNDYLSLNLARQIYWNDYQTNPDPDSVLRLQDGLGRPLWDRPEEAELLARYPDGMPSMVFPGMVNRNAPDNTIITRCPNHRSYTKRRGDDTDPGKDIVLRLDGSVTMLPVKAANYDWAIQSPQTH